MKILKYIIFISMLSSLFFVIYRQSDKNGFRRWRISFKTSVLIAASVAGLIPVNPEAIKPPGNNNPVYQERLISEQEFNSFEDNDGQVILAKADGNPVTPPTNRGPSQFPTPPAGAGGGAGAAEFDDQCPVSKKQQSQESKTFDYDYRSNDPKKKKKTIS